MISLFLLSGPEHGKNYHFALYPKFLLPSTPSKKILKEIFHHAPLIPYTPSKIFHCFSVPKACPLQSSPSHSLPQILKSVPSLSVTEFPKSFPSPNPQVCSSVPQAFPSRPESPGLSLKITQVRIFSICFTDKESVLVAVVPSRNCWYKSVASGL